MPEHPDRFARFPERDARVRRDQTLAMLHAADLGETTALVAPDGRIVALVWWQPATTAERPDGEPVVATAGYVAVAADDVRNRYLVGEVDEPTRRMRHAALGAFAELYVERLADEACR